ncbi:TrmH family RNA methyltransferase [Breoghania corrubedonensis]|uniref:TrmH family RNA methyltransferase n=1 Tax=Breoghania corrubedonensis TaxID=665038 RepID=A0A2T5VFK1_9HYPH|nr:RNA methyltransferase [Breoghania corrubedonensis]PTW62532.1 TrmH family RNA methyltransferase [Breoghania corrubedonensis]
MSPEKNEAGRPGQVKTVTSVSNPVIKDIRALVSQRKRRKEAGLFVAEGLKLVTDAMQAGWPIRTLVFGGEVRDQPMVSKAAATARARGALVLDVSRAVLTSITRRDNPQMVVGVFEQQWAVPGKIAAKDAALWIGLDEVRDPGNLGTIVRTADAVGADGVVLIGDTTDPFAVEAVRATMGSIFYVPLVRMSRPEFLKWRTRWPGVVVGTHLKGETDYRKADYSGPVLLLMGTEQSGLPEEMADACSQLVRIPQAGKADSLNLAVATAVMLFEIKRKTLEL